uniref:MADF domain-containing protein n=1 Tax=Panagrolaimus sp. PS1159 TaxID=55785 RepID=A0AC35GJW4_9BILA
TDHHHQHQEDASTTTSARNRPMTFNELLIKEVRSHPELYDQQHRVCTDNGERNLIWESIAARIDDSVSGEFAKKRWLQMRDRYRKELKSALRSGVIPKWPYFEKLSWLDPYLKDNKPGSISSSFIGQHTFSSSTPNLLQNDEESAATGELGGELMDFTNYAANLSANTLLENIMAVSGGSFSTHHNHMSDIKNLSGEFSPDSAVASTSEDGDTHRLSSSQPSERPDSTETPINETTNNSSSHALLSTFNSFNNHSAAAAGLLMKLEAMNNVATAAAVSSSVEHQKLLDQKLLNAFRQSNSSSPTRGGNNSRSIRNPPYLVRRGGGQKVKPQTGKKQNSSDFIVSSPRSLSESSMNEQQQQQQGQQLRKLDKESLEEFFSKEWANDEDMLFARLVVVRLKKFAAKERRGIRARISELIDEKEEEIEGGGGNKRHLP